MLALKLGVLVALLGAGQVLSIFKEDTLASGNIFPCVLYTYI